MTSNNLQKFSPGDLWTQIKNLPWKRKAKPSRRELTYLLGSMATLVENGVSLPRALGTLAQERSLKKFSKTLVDIKRSLEAGESFSNTLAKYPDLFDEVTVHQIRVGEQSGTVAKSLRRVAARIEKANEMRAKILKRLSYPIVVAIAGATVVGFMLVTVVPQFEETYRSAKVPLPVLTECMITVGAIFRGYGWLAPVIGVLTWVGLKKIRQRTAWAMKIDQFLLNLPLIGDWVRDISVLQFVDVLNVMMQSGFKLVDALRASGGAVKNYAVREAVLELQAAVLRGERLSKELTKHEELFPPMVSQLVIIGEQTGNLARSTDDIRAHLRMEVERKADLFVRILEPTLTIALAIAIGLILLAVYLPMFSMVDTVK